MSNAALENATPRTMVMVETGSSNVTVFAFICELCVNCWNRIWPDPSSIPPSDRQWCQCCSCKRQLP